MFHLFAALGQFERDLIRERAQAWPRRRKPVATNVKLKRARALVAKGLTVRSPAARLKMGKAALYEAVRDA